MAPRRLFNVKGLFRMLSCKAFPFLEPFGFPPLNVAIHWQDYIARSGLTPTGAIPENHAGDSPVTKLT
jgi:hypothetical protein